MLKKIRHNLPMKILSVVIAVLFWFVVYTNENPIETRQLNIALTPINVEAIANDNLRILNEYDKEVEITVRGRKSEIDQVSASDYTAYLDFNSIESADAEYIEISDFSYLGDRNVISEMTGSGRVGLSLDRIILNEIPITVEIVGEPAEGFVILNTPELHPPSFTVTDIEGRVSQIAEAIVTIDVTGMKGTETEIMFCVVLDEDGNEINEYKNSKAIDITVNIAKSVPVEVKLEGVPAVDHISSGVIPNPTHVQVSGPEEELAMIEKVSSLPVNIENAEESFTVTTGLQTLPAGVGYVGSGEVEVSVAIEALQTKTLIFNPYNVNIRYGLNSKNYEVRSTNIELVIKGRKGVLDAVTASTVNAYIDVAKTDDGELSLPLRFENLDNVEQISYPLVDVYIQTVKDIAVYIDDVFIENKVGGKYMYVLPNVVANLKVIGLSENIDLITKDNLNPTVNADGLTEGTHSVEIYVDLPEGVSISGTLTTILQISEN